MAQSINDFKREFAGGTRKNRFRVTGNFPYGGGFNIFQTIAAKPCSLARFLVLCKKI